MTDEMRAAVYLGPEKIELRALRIPEPKEGELLVKVRWIRLFRVEKGVV